MRISAINSNYQPQKTLKKNQVKNNTNMTTPSFEGAKKLNKTSAKNLALALMVGLTVAIPTVKSCCNQHQTTNEYSATFDGKNDFYIDPVVKAKYYTKTSKPYEHKNFDIYACNSDNFDKLNSFILNDSLYEVRNSFDSQLLNYYAQNPQEKNLPNNETIQGFINNYNQNKDYYQDKATFKDAQEILNKYKEISQEYGITEREAVWNFPATDRFCYQCQVGASQYDYYEAHGQFMNPASENRKKIQDFIISYDGSQYDDTQKLVLSNMKAYLPEVIDEINTRAINSEIHYKMGSDKSKGGDYKKYLEPAPKKSPSTSSAVAKTTTTTKPSTTTTTAPAKTTTSANTTYTKPATTTTTPVKTTTTTQSVNRQAQINDLKNQIAAKETKINDLKSEIGWIQARISINSINYNSNLNSINSCADSIDFYQSNLSIYQDSYANSLNDPYASNSRIDSSGRLVTSTENTINRYSDMAYEYEYENAMIDYQMSIDRINLDSKTIELKNAEIELQRLNEKLNSLQ